MKKFILFVSLFCLVGCKEPIGRSTDLDRISARHALPIGVDSPSAEIEPEAPRKVKERFKRYYIYLTANAIAGRSKTLIYTRYLPNYASTIHVTSEDGIKYIIPFTSISYIEEGEVVIYE